MQESDEYVASIPDAMSCGTTACILDGFTVVGDNLAFFRLILFSPDIRQLK